MKLPVVLALLLCAGCSKPKPDAVVRPVPVGICPDNSQCTTSSVPVDDSDMAKISSRMDRIQEGYNILFDQAEWSENCTRQTEELYKEMHCDDRLERLKVRVKAYDKKGKK